MNSVKVHNVSRFKHVKTSDKVIFFMFPVKRCAIKSMSLFIGFADDMDIVGRAFRMVAEFQKMTHIPTNRLCLAIFQQNYTNLFTG